MLVYVFPSGNKKPRDGSATPKSSRSRSPSRGRSPGRPKGSKNRAKAGEESKSPSRGRSRSNSVARVRRKPASENQESSIEVVASQEQQKTPGRKSKPAQVVEPVEPVFVPETQLQPHSDEDTDVLLRSTIKALQTHVIKTATPVEKDVATTPRKSPRMKASPKSVTTETQTVSLAYEEHGRVVTQTTQTIETTTTETHAHEHGHGHSHGHSHESSSSSSTTVVTEGHQQVEEEEVESSALVLHAPRARNHGGFIDMITKMTERGWLVSFLSVAVVVGSLLASQVVPRDANSDLWRAWLPFLTPIVALLLFFHQKDDRTSAKWVAIALSWRCAAELLVLIGSIPGEFQSVAVSAAAIANLALLIAVGSLVRNKEHETSKATLVALAVATLALFLADRYESFLIVHRHSLQTFNAAIRTILLVANKLYVLLLLCIAGW